MSTQILMPALSPTMEEGKLAKWLVKEGDAVKSGDILAEIETDKATMEFEAVDEGRIGKILVPEGTEGVKVNSPIAELVGEGEDSRTQPAPCGESAASRSEPLARGVADADTAPKHSSASRQRSAAAQARPQGEGERSRPNPKFPPAPNSSP